MSKYEAEIFPVYPQWEEMASSEGEYDKAKFALIGYLTEGQPISGTNDRGVTTDVIRFMLLRAGYTELAVNTHWDGYGEHIMTEQQPTNDGQKITFELQENNPYGLEAGNYGISTIPGLLLSQRSDYPEGQDKQRASLLDQFKQFEAARAALLAAGMRWRSMSHWKVDEGEVKFMLNPEDHYRYRSLMWVTAAELKAWSRGEGPIVLPEHDKLHYPPLRG